MSHKKVKAYISRKGYVIDKESISLNDIKMIKEELYIMPEVKEEFASDVKPYPMYHEFEKHIIVPRYYGVKKFGDVEKKLAMKKNNFKFTGTLRDYQIKIVDEILPKIIGRGGGLISLPCGRGKTVIALNLAHKLGLKTLVLVHKTFLQDQWIARAQEFTTAKIGIIRQSKVDVENKDIVIGMLQSVSMKNYDAEIFNSFGLIIVDECHHIASRVFSKALYKTGTLYTIGLSATPQRSDGLSKVIYWYLGRMLYCEERNSNCNVIVRKLSMILDDPLFVEKTQWTPKGTIPSLPKMITNLSKIKRRNKVIVNVINTLRKNPKRKILILSNRISHLEYLKKKIDRLIEKDVKNNKILKNECNTFYYIGKTKQDERKQAENNGDIIFASYSMAQEGLDISSLNTLILATPQRSITQAIGRIMRKILSDTDIKPLIVDICDHLSSFLYQCYSRTNLYKKNKYNIQEYVFDNNYQVPIQKYLKSNKKIDKSDHIKISEIFSKNELDKICNKNKFYDEVEMKKEHQHEQQEQEKMFGECLFE